MSLETFRDLYSLQWHGIHPGLERTEMLLSLLGHPENGFQSIHIAGTNGKGSTAAIIAAVLQEAGYRVGLYTSPHLIDFSERFRINGLPIPEEEVTRLIQDLKEQINADARLSMEDITFFEFATAMAFSYFSREKVDYAVVEVGLGGRFDATNLLSPQVCAITNISLDHEEYLGKTVIEIAGEKAGIIKEGIPVVTAVTQEGVIDLLRGVAQSKNAPLIRVGEQIRLEGQSPKDFFYHGRNTRRVRCPLLGAHQIYNSAVALGVIDALLQQGVSIPEVAIIKGVEGVQWSGRLEVIRINPMVILDGAHNPAGALALAAFLEDLDPERKGRHWLIVGMMKDKNIAGVLGPLLPWADEVVLTRPNIERAVDPHRLLQFSKTPSIIQDSVSKAIHYVESRLQSNDTVVIAGSLYLVGEAKALYLGVALSPIRG